SPAATPPPEFFRSLATETRSLSLVAITKTWIARTAPQQFRSTAASPGILPRSRPPDSARPSRSSTTTRSSPSAPAARTSAPIRAPTGRQQATSTSTQLPSSIAPTPGPSAPKAPSPGGSPVPGDHCFGALLPVLSDSKFLLTFISIGLLACPRLRRFLRGDPGGDARIEYIERERAAIQNFVVKCPDVIFAAELGARAVAQFQNFELAEFVRKGLRGNGDVAISLGLHTRLVFGRVRVKKVDHLLARPMLVMHAGIEHRADSAQHFIREAAVIRVGILIEADIFSEALGIKRPSFDVTGVAGLLAKRRQTGQSLRDGNLQVVAGNTLVVCSGFHVHERAVGKVAGVHADDS